MENLLSLVLRAFEKRRHLHQIDYLNHAQHAKIRTTTKEEACDDLQKKKSKKKTVQNQTRNIDPTQGLDLHNDPFAISANCRALRNGFLVRN